jgi:excisionase family DNA binding protein
MGHGQEARMSADPADHEQLTFEAPLLLTAQQAARVLGQGFTAHWVYEAARSGELPCVRIGRKVRFVRGDLDAYVAAKRTTADPAARLGEDWRRRPQMALAAARRKRGDSRLAASDGRPRLS